MDWQNIYMINDLVYEKKKKNLQYSLQHLYFHFQVSPNMVNISIPIIYAISLDLNI